MFRSFFASWKWAPLSYGGSFLLLALFYLQVDTAWRFAEWIGVLGDVVSGAAKYNQDEFLSKFVYEAAKIAGLFVLIQAFINLISSIFCWFWYEAITYHYLPNWNKTIQDVECPAQRFQDSIDTFVNKFLGMSKAVVRSIMVLCKFLPKLWVLSDHFNFFYFNHVPGMLVWIVILVSIFGVLISFLVGIHLKECRYDIASARGAFRSGLEFVQRNKKKDDSIPTLTKLMKKTRKCSLRLFHNKFWFDIWAGSYAQVWAVIPITFFGYNVFSGYVKYGLVTKTASALGEVVGAMSIPIWLWDEFTDFLSVVQRLKELEKVINDPEKWEETKKEIGWEDRRKK
ncbi:hypothetical protein D4R99_04225 [bacterium]|nr:MAG: hypothetical protein D4R99_04225 [bacterium]